MTAKGLDYAIIVPSRKRAQNMPVLRSLLPSALICIDERERADYRSVPKNRLLLHPPMDGLPAILNWMQEAVTEPILIVIDDDFIGVQVNTGSKRFIIDPDEILSILENSAQACADLGLTTFCYSRTQNTTVIRPDERPIVPTQAVCNARGFMGAARHRKFDVSMHGRADVDWTMRTLLEDRCVYADVRFYFDCGAIYSGQGGSVGLITPEVFDHSSRELRARWGKSMSFKAPSFVKNRNVTAMSLRVSRTSKLAQR
jgi:hypothetical protein